MSSRCAEPEHRPNLLSDNETAAVEQIARNVHDVWAQGRLDEGWTYGPVRDDALKHHPCLVDYDDLPDSEREYDRATALGTLKLITKFGFRIVKD